MYEYFQSLLKAIRELPINELDKRQPMLVDLLAQIVNHETQDGALTAAAGNTALECMDYWQTLAEVVDDCGFELLGNGHFSAAYKHELLPGKVIKVGFKKEDSGAAYVAFCRMHQGRAGIPKVHDVQRHAGCYTVVLDELQEFHRADGGELGDQFDCVSLAIDTGYNMAQMVKAFPECTKYTALTETAIEIRKFFAGIAHFDMHSGNVMVDHTGNLVITDPVSFSHDKAELPMDVEGLLAEVEKAAQLRMIERCRDRKARRDPNGNFQYFRRHNCKARRRHRKAMAKRAAETAQRAKEFNLGEIEARITANIVHAQDAHGWRRPEAFNAVI
ncbi:hypothetical protein [Klebsiella phage 175002]